MSTERINAAIRRILEGCARVADPAEYARECIAILKADRSWSAEDLDEVQDATLLIVNSLSQKAK
jgi:hypothetical protein